MEKKPKNVRNSKAMRRSFYVAMYASLGGLLVLALGIGYYNLIGPGAGPSEVPVVQGQIDLFGQTGEEESYPVGSQWELPVGGRPQTTPVPQPQTTPQPHEVQPQPAPRPPAEGDWEEEGEQAEVYWPAVAAEPPDDDEGADAEPPSPAADIYSVFEPQPGFDYFAEGDSMHWPLLGDILMDFAMDRLVFDPTLDQWRTNDTLAISAERGASVRAAAAGRVQEIALTRQFGQIVVIDHGNGWTTTYSQLDPDVVVNVGDVVNRGQIIGSVGSPSIFAGRLGYHVGFAVRSDEMPVNPNGLLVE